MSDALEYANSFLLGRYGIDCARVFAPIDAHAPQGDMLRGTPLWQSIRRAREADDASLPQGAWVKRLKRAEWDEVARAALDALATRSKDLQLAVWLAEALLREHGFTGLAAGTVIIDGLCRRYWRTLYPMPSSDEQEYEHRANLVRWFNEKLLVPARLVPLTSGAAEPDAEGSPRAFAWADFAQSRQARHALQGSARERAEHDERDDGPQAAELAQALAATSNDALVAAHRALDCCNQALAELDATLDACFERNAPGVGQLAGLLGEIAAFVAAELDRRGLLPAGEAADATGTSAGPAGSGGHGDDGIGIGIAEPDGCAAPDEQAPEPARAAGENAAIDARGSEADQERRHLCAPALATRQRAYLQLAEAADLLAQLEPHSPVPYLVRRAIEWGALNTAQLYDTLFIRGQGQLNLFELLGIGVPQAEEAT
ncbi:type VI secretion system protein TssA [Trinickia caryophylli]|uniref:Type VI secretion system protein ImpA n=1 Tax=Trinickia caryophylli TaxID=28094 RepID=A0A1X7D554_TRICW|nr:type VI secretion system protein TssA [Trinickia caryophylli]PMS12720.1 type VI secretion system protein TssA [Trinickia caryophylli]TRX15126.1 type VI secretion system protein TssA [Trinickia caryophylli]WQE14989.1 type VI secretion system protein TssA [Trinickia caryophylli]SMF09115.1 type VI secretion system protein ImpA [Trinickia caryophylli]GLU31282.1 hypothetical protein Busp01_11240 [Trinickia caryophylli]